MRTPELLSLLDSGGFRLEFVTKRGQLVELRRANLMRKKLKSLRKYGQSYKQYVTVRCEDTQNIYKVYLVLILKINGKNYIY